MNQREIFLRHVAQTSPAPLALEITKASGVTLYAADGKTYTDLIGGISVANMGHGHPAVLAAIRAQSEAYLHIMVYGEFVESPQVRYAQQLASLLPASLNSVYFTNSGAEAVEGAMKLAKRVTRRTGIIAFNNSYHGSTQGALSIIGDEYWRNAYRPLLPDVSHLEYNSFASLDSITDRTACVFAETVQAEAGVKPPSVEWMKALREKCTTTGTLLVLDEIQTGFGRTGTLWGFEQYGIVPDILLLGKALGGGLPLGAFIADRALMGMLAENPVLGHITTFGGHPLSCAAGSAALQAMLEEKVVEQVETKGRLLDSLLSHPLILGRSRAGLWLSLRFDTFETNKWIIDRCIAKGILTDWFLFASDSLRISPPLIITEAQLREVAATLLSVLDEYQREFLPGK
ncbi:MAG: aspartate aminotransferase family protein [Chitinophagaceae bacterium]|nr:MAG: aspartate aminotransferase family protein [Chitinophagaceae bacterium]